MNKQIKELCIKSGAWEHYEVNEGVDNDEQPMEKFARLIVQECVTVVVDAVDHREPASTYASKIQQHFGVE